MRLSQATTTTTTTTAATTTANNNDLDAEADDDHVGDDDQEEQQHSKSPPFMTTTITGPKQHNDQQQQQQQRRQRSSTKISSKRSSSLKKSITRRLSSLVSGLLMKNRRSSSSSTNHVDEFAVVAITTEEEMLSVLWTKHSLAYKRTSDIYYAVNLRINILSSSSTKEEDFSASGIRSSSSVDGVDEIQYYDSFDNNDSTTSGCRRRRLLYPPICLGKASGSRRVSHPNSKFKLCGSTRTVLLQCIQMLSSCNRRLHVTMNTCDYPNDHGLTEFISLINKRQLLESFTIQQSCSVKGQDRQQKSILLPIFQSYLKINRNLTHLNLKLWEGSKCLIDSNKTASIIKDAITKSKTLQSLKLDYHPQNRGANYIESYFQIITEGIASNTSIEILTLTLYNNNKFVELLVGHTSIKKLHIRGPYKRMSCVENGGTNALIDMHLMPYEKLITSSQCKLEILKLSGQGLRSCFVDKLLSIELWANHPLKVLDVSENAIQNLQFPNYVDARNPHPWKIIKAKSNPISIEYYTSSCQTSYRVPGVAAMFQPILNTEVHCHEILPLIQKYPNLTVDWIDDNEDVNDEEDDNKTTTTTTTSSIEKLLRINMDNVENQCILDYHFLKNIGNMDRTLSQIPLLGPYLFERTMKIFILMSSSSRTRSSSSRSNMTMNKAQQQRQANLIYQLWVKPYLPHLLLLQLNEKSTMQQETTAN